jgi:glycosyltransferase involved in cell wall biosynthesis
MLEAMALGLPVVCTDCPAGGARAVIEDHINGLLVPVGDVEALYNAMKELIDNPELAAKISSNATAIRDTLSVDKITNQWLELIHG